VENPATWNDDVKAVAASIHDYDEACRQGIIGHSLMARIEQDVVAPLRSKLNFILQVLDLMDTHDSGWNLVWRVEGDDPGFAVNCNDVFWWGCADAEDLTLESLPVLVQAFEDAGDDGLVLYCARMRKMRPQGAMYKHIGKDHWALFDACGPIREVDILNPHKHPLLQEQ